jgi:hypothetical protein
MDGWVGGCLLPPRRERVTSAARARALVGDERMRVPLDDEALNLKRKVPKRRLKRMLAEFDEDGSGQISFGEVCCVCDTNFVDRSIERATKDDDVLSCEFVIRRRT